MSWFIGRSALLAFVSDLTTRSHACHISRPLSLYTMNVYNSFSISILYLPLHIDLSFFRLNYIFTVLPNDTSLLSIGLLYSYHILVSILWTARVPYVWNVPGFRFVSCILTISNWSIFWYRQYRVHNHFEIIIKTYYIHKIVRQRYYVYACQI